MLMEYIDNVRFKKMLLGAAVNLENNKSIVCLLYTSKWNFSITLWKRDFWIS